MSEIQQFESLVKQLMANENDVRQRAEGLFRNASKEHPEKLAMSLLQLIRTSQSTPIRELCTILLRKSLTAKDDNKTAIIRDQPNELDKSVFWNKLSPQVRQNIKNELLNAVTQEPDAAVRKKLCHTISELSLYLCANTGSWNIEQEWKELLPALNQLASSQNVNHRISALDIFAKLCLYCGDAIKMHSQSLQSLLQKGLNDQQSIKVRISALTATVSFIQLLETDEERKLYSPFIPMMFNTLNVCITQKKEAEARISLEILVELVDLEPTFLRPHLPTVVKAMVNIANATNFPEQMRQLGLEFLTTLAERAPGMVRQLPEYINLVLPIVLNFMLMLPDDPTWGEKDDEEDEVEITNSDIGDECLDRLALHIGGPVLIPPLFALIKKLLAQQDWKHRHTGLMALSLVAEGCSGYLEPHLNDIISIFLPFFKDPHPRVRWAACNVAGQMSTDFGTALPFRFNDKILPNLCQLMDDKANPRVQCHATSALINFCEHAVAKNLIPFLDAILQKLSMLLQNGKRNVQEQAVTAIAAIADVVKENFLKYYDHFVPLLKNILWKAKGDDFRQLRGRSMECVTLIAIGVGKKKFAPDAKAILDILLETEKSNLEYDDPQLPFLRAAWARMCNVLQQDFAPYLEIALTPLLKSASIDPDLTVSDEEGGTQEGFQYIPIGNKRIGINTALMDEKATACNMIFQYAVALKGNFFPFVRKVVEILVPLIQFYFHDGVRAAATAAMPALLESVRDHQAQTTKDKGPLNSLFELIYKNLVDGIDAEIDIDVLLLMLETICEAVRICGPETMTNQQMAAGCKLVLSQFDKRATRMQERFEERNNQDFDEIEAEKLKAENMKDNEALSCIAEFVGRILSTHKASFLPTFQQLLFPRIMEMIQPNRTIQDRQAGLCIIDDMVEHTGPHSLQFFQHFMPLMIKYISDPSHEIRQAAVFGIGVCAIHGGDNFGKLIPPIMESLTSVIMHAQSRVKPNVAATENAISAVGKICQHQGKAFDQKKGIELWFTFLPVEEDKIEARITYGQLCYFIENFPQQIFGEGYKNLPKVLTIFAGILGTELVNEQVTKSILALLQKMRTTFPAELLQKAVSTMPQNLQQKLQAVMK